MENTRKFIPILLLIFLVAFSACLETKQETSAPKSIGIGKTKGVEITEFSSLTYIDSNEPIDISLYVQNMGDSKATDVSAILYQKSGFIDDKTRAIKIEGSDLEPPAEEFNIPGDVFSQSWPLIAPSVNEEQQRSILSRIDYSYKSIASTNIQLVGKSEWDSRGGAGAFTTYSTSSEAPVTLKILSVPAIRISSDVEDKTVPIDIIFENTGLGVINSDYVNNFQLSFKTGEKTVSFDDVDNVDNSWPTIAGPDDD